MMVITAGIQQVHVVHDEKKMNLFRNNLSQEDLQQLTNIILSYNPGIDEDDFNSEDVSGFMYVSDDDIDRERNKSNSSNGKQPSFEASDEQMSSSDTRFNFRAQPNDSNARSSRTFSKQPRTSKPSTSKRRQQSPAGSQSKRTNRGRGQRDRTDSLSDSLAGKRENECRLQ